jgi:hypothetical protein
VNIVAVLALMDWSTFGSSTETVTLSGAGGTPVIVICARVQLAVKLGGCPGTDSVSGPVTFATSRVGR